MVRDLAEVQFSPILTLDLDDDGQARSLSESDGDGTIVVVCLVTFLTTEDVHEGRCAMPSQDEIPLAGSFRLSVSLPIDGRTRRGIRIPFHLSRPFRMK